MKSGKIKLSPSALNLFNDCPRCFWLDKVKGIKRPRGIFPSLPGGMDRVIKDYFDAYRKDDALPPEFSSDSFSTMKPYSNQQQLDLWREWKTGPQYKDEEGNILFGAIDDLMVNDGAYIPFDYKTKGTPTTVEAAKKYYSNQLNCYSLMLEAMGLPQAGYGYLLYYSPKNVREKGWVLFNLQAVKIDTSTEAAKKTFSAAVSLLCSDEVPPRQGECEYCEWAGQVMSHQELFAE